MRFDRTMAGSSAPGQFSTRGQSFSSAPWGQSFRVQHPGDSAACQGGSTRGQSFSSAPGSSAPGDSPSVQHPGDSVACQGVVVIASGCGRSDDRFSSSGPPAKRLSGRNPLFAEYARRQRIGMTVDSPRIELQPFVQL
jgi:hypothetical protein